MKEIKLLETQLQKLDQKDFDLEAWKQYTVVLLARIFGPDDPKIKQVEKIEYDFSSWSLRDTTGKSAYMETCKKLGREILQASIDELEAFGVPSKELDERSAIPVNVILAALEEELKVSQIRKISDIVNSDKSTDDKARSIREILDALDGDFAKYALVLMLSHPDLSGKL